MNLALGIYDTFTHLVPGSLYLALLIHISERLGWLNIGALKDINATLLLIGAALASYLLGHIGYAFGRYVDYRVPSPGKQRYDPIDLFIGRTSSSSKAKSLSKVDEYLLLAAAEVRAKEAAVEITRLRAIGLMLRNSFPALGLASIVCLAEAVLGANLLLTLCSSAFLLVTAFATLYNGRMYIRWATSKTLEIAFWVTGPDDINALQPTDKSSSS